MFGEGKRGQTHPGKAVVALFFLFGREFRPIEFCNTGPLPELFVVVGVAKLKGVSVWLDQTRREHIRSSFSGYGMEMEGNVAGGVMGGTRRASQMSDYDTYPQAPMNIGMGLSPIGQVQQQHHHQGHNSSISSISSSTNILAHGVSASGGGGGGEGGTGRTGLGLGMNSGSGMGLQGMGDMGAAVGSMGMGLGLLLPEPKPRQYPRLGPPLGLDPLPSQVQARCLHPETQRLQHIILVSMAYTRPLVLPSTTTITTTTSSLAVAITVAVAPALTHRPLYTLKHKPRLKDDPTNSTTSSSASSSSSISSTTSCDISISSNTNTNTVRPSSSSSSSSNNFR
ncbi:hypothetical protein Cob_v006970 [Colletotrichum orbiculare MAFF 240422]|uniref:Uncharacterized protein n=1 Tax=Colletotrichum orbiculare (strain 104-T / ATCC 96160 / CBS 514.97 / LARS 414 / MAFF 240422) TaxID=1213857 RepID=A0A484FQC4_COLOR|nr:hypothetical protein Cob_v006970 [Colletotrichum orbiculare MAFF 240422]